MTDTHNLHARSEDEPAESSSAESPPAEVQVEPTVLPTDVTPTIASEIIATAEKVGKTKKKKDKKKAKDASLGTSRGIETMFRTSYRVHMELSSIADAKANIMISVNGLLISITLAAVAPAIQRNALSVLPVSVFLIGCSIALVYAVLAARPRVNSTPMTLADIEANDANILFFGNFVNMPEDEFVDGMKNLMQDTEHLYVNMIRDLYGLGKVLTRKFELLRISYNVFMVALVVGVLISVGTYFVDADLAREILTTPARITP